MILWGNKTKNQGFTLVELLVVISIIAILAVVGITVFSGVQKSARDARRKADLHAISLALESYKAMNSSYPATGGWVYSDSATNPWLTGLNTSYMTSAPKDPQNSGGAPWNGGYTYAYFTFLGYGGTNGGYFMLIAHLESPNSADKKTKCIFPDGTCYGSNDSGCGVGRIYTDNFFVCNQQ